MRKYLLLLLVMMVAAAPAVAQQSSKSKTKPRLREKSVPVVNKATIFNSKEINSKSPDYSPAFYGRGVVFASSRQKTGARSDNGQTFSELWYAPFDPNRVPARPQKFSISLNNKDHEGPVTFSRNQRTIFYTQNNNENGVRKSDKSGVSRLKIYTAKKGLVDWEPKGELPFNSDSYSCLHPSLSADEQYLYFASDMPGGFGGFDIYVSEKQPDKTWGAPRNLGAAVNTPKSELFPFIHVDGTLFFASSGHNTLGGFDIFLVEPDDQGNDKVTNLNEVLSKDTPINSPSDEMSFIIDDDLRRGFFTSDRPEGSTGNQPYSLGKDDIFGFILEKSIEGAAQPESQHTRLIVTDGRNGAPVRNAEIRILKSSADGFVDNDNQTFDVNFQPVEGRNNTFNIEYKRKDAVEISKRPDLTTTTEGSAYYDFGRFRSYVILVNAPGFQPYERIYTTPETEGDAQLNIELFTAPVCHGAGGIVSTDQLGTRIANATIKLVHKVNNHSVTVRTNMNGEFDVCLPYPGGWLVQIERAGYQPDNYELTAEVNNKAFNEVKLKPTQLAGSANSAEAERSNNSAFKPGSVIVLDRINFEPNQTTLNSSAIRNLDALYDLLVNYPTMEIDLVAHTDARGDARNNLKVSEERADNARAYLLHRGTEESRIRAVGKGGSAPRNRCAAGVECTEAEHKSNVRIEIVVRKI